MTPTTPLCRPACPTGRLPAGTQGPPGAQGPPPALAAGNVTYLAPGANPVFALRANPAGGYFVDFGLPQGPVGSLTQSAAEALFALLNPTNGTYRVVTDNNGTRLEVWNPDQMKFQTVVIRGAAGQESLSILPADS